MKFFALTSLLPLLAFGAEPSNSIWPAAPCDPSTPANCRSAIVHRPAKNPVVRIVRIMPTPKGTAPTQPQAPAYLTNQAGRMMIGQTTFTNQDIEFTSSSLLGAVGGVAYANNTLFITDSNKIQATPVQNRVLIYDSVSSFIYTPTDEIPQGIRCPVCIGPETRGANVVVGQPDFVSSGIDFSSTATTPTPVGNGLRTPTGVASDGNILVIADTDNNRVLIWKTIPTTNGVSADLVLGQPNLTAMNPPPIQPTASSLRGPQGVWIQGTRLFVADTQNHRIVVWNNIPTTNNQPADYVIGEPNLTTAPPITVSDIAPQPNNMFSPTSVSSDGQHLFVSDLGHNRVLIWNSIPTTNNVPADVEVGQPDFVSEAPNNVQGACVTNGTDSDGNPTYPAGCNSFCPYNSTDTTTGTQLFPFTCGRVLNFPRFALSDGTRLYIADGGNDRILVYNTIPTQNAAMADEAIGQQDLLNDQVNDSTTNTIGLNANTLSSAPNTIRTPLALAWDGTNLYATDPYDRRVLVFTPATPSVQTNGIVNAFSLVVYAVGTVDFGGTITAGDVITVTINGTAYNYTVVSTDTLQTITTNVLNVITSSNNGAGDPNVLARANPGINEIVLTARTSGAAGDAITLAATVAGPTSTAVPTETATASGAALNGGANASDVAPGTLITIFGTGLSDVPAAGVAGTPDSQGYYPSLLGGAEVYFDGIKAPLFFVSPTQINTQIPYEVDGSNGSSSFVRTVHNDGSITASTSIAIPIVPVNPGILAQPGSDPRQGIAYHASSNAIGIVSVDGSILANDIATVTIENRSYNYTIESTDSLTTVRDALMALINGNTEEIVTASPSGEFTRIILTAKVAGPDGNNIPITVSENTGALIVLSALTPTTCCANVSGAPITLDNPAVPGEVINIYATGIGQTVLPDGATPAGSTGQVYTGPAYNLPVTPIDNAQLSTTTANVLGAALIPGMVGVYQVTIQIATTLPTNANTQLFIAQSTFTSNIVVIPVQAP
jgi:uncharacterized protein (TIGR03437 family)